MERKREYWQSIRGICILAVVLIHSLGGFDYSVGYDTEFIVLRQVINFAVATFVFMSGYFVPVEKICNKDFSYKEWILNRGGGDYAYNDASNPTPLTRIGSDHGPRISSAVVR